MYKSAFWPNNDWQKCFRFIHHTENGKSCWVHALWDTIFHTVRYCILKFTGISSKKVHIFHVYSLRTVSLALLDLRAASVAWHSYSESSVKSADVISRLYCPTSRIRKTRYRGHAETHTPLHFNTINCHILVFYAFIILDADKIVLQISQLSLYIQSNSYLFCLESMNVPISSMYFTS